MQRRTPISFVVAMTVLSFALTAGAQTSIDGAELALCSSGKALGKAWVFDTNGFVGTYVQLDAPGEVSVNAEVDQPNLVELVIGDARVRARADGRFALAAGTHFVRIQHSNHTPGADVTIRSLTVSGATVKNEPSDANALAAADTYIANGRRGTATVKLEGVAPGTQVRAKLTRHAFIFGTAVGGFGSPNELFVGPPGSDQDHYAKAVLKHFQAIVPGNAGKWDSNERERGRPTMQYIDWLRDFAKTNGLRMRMHALIWNTGQQPKWAIELVNAAARGDAKAKEDLRRAIGERIKYYVRDRATSYDQMDVLNEPLHQSKYWDIFGADSIADIYREAQQAIIDAGAHTRLCVNEYNILQYSSRPPFKRGAEPDPYANWYREWVEQVQAANGPVGGIGVQYYAFTETDIPSPHSAARIFGVFQNLSVSGLPIILSEFGVKTKCDPKRVPDILEDAMRVSFGTPDSTGFILWGFWRKELWGPAKGAAFYEDDWAPTDACKRWDELMSRWTTDETLTVSPEGTITFTGYFGDYELSAGDRTIPLTLVKGQSQYTAGAR